MSHPLFFPGITYFYPVGNTSALRLTEHLPPEQEANILLLACGDPRHILYTVYTNETNSNIEPQKLDITCCDVEVAVLARNAILFTLLADEGAQERMNLIWNIFYHFMLDQASLSLLVGQCRKLATLAKDLESWHAGPYARFLTVCDARTLEDLSRFWGLYAATADYAPDQHKRFTKCFVDGIKDTRDQHGLGKGLIMTSSRSAGPLLPLAMEAVAEQFRAFWAASGVTDDGLHGMEQATLVNPTFAFSQSGDKFAVHYGVDPVAGFHLAEVVATSHREMPGVLVQKLVRAARNQFFQWCTSVSKLLQANCLVSSKLVIRMFAGDALRLCQAFSHLNAFGAIVTPIHNRPWRASRIEFDENQYGEGAPTPAPTTFNVIDTSNISDHVGLLNLLVVTVPILSRSPSATLYTEALLSYSGEPSAGVLERLCGDMQSMSLLLGVIPSAFLSRFTTRSNVHETLVQVLKGLQYHEQIAWKAISGEHLISFTPDQLGRLLFKIYLKMFSDENLTRQWQNLSSSVTRAYMEQSLVHYTRHSFVQLLCHIKSQVQTDWTHVMETFDDQVVRDDSLILNSNFYQEMCCHFHLLGIVTFTSMEESYVRDVLTKTQSTLFGDWESIPAVVTVVLMVPRNRIRAVESDLREAGTPLLLCEIRNATVWNSFADITVAYGQLETTGKGQKKAVTIVEDKAGESTSSPLVVYFTVPSSMLLLSENATVGFRTRPSPRTSRRLRLFEAIFTAPLEDSRYVHLLAESPSQPIARSTGGYSHMQATRESKQVFNVEMNESFTEIRSFVLRVDITDTVGQTALAAGSSVKLEQMPIDEARLYIGTYSKEIRFPLPVDAANAKFRVARKSKYIEVTAPLALSMRMRNERGIANRFFPVLESGIPTSLNFHRVSLSRCPSFQPSKKSERFAWLNPHVSLMFSQRERAEQERESPSLRDTFVNVKASLHSLLLSAAGVQGPARSVFALQNTSTGGFLALVIVADLRLDLGSHTVLADAWIVPGTRAVRNKVGQLQIDVIIIKVDPDESEAWRYLLPLFVERCRTWTHQPNCEYVKHGTIPVPLHGSADPEGRWFCACGVGVGTEILPQRFQALGPYATRAAISPLFAVPYLEKVGMMDDESSASESDKEPLGGCRACGKQGGSLSVCGKCKCVRYCSKECQVKDWRAHKKHCGT